MSSSINRRELLSSSLAAAASLSALHAAPAKTDDDSGTFKLGVASYSFRKLSRAEAIKAMEELKCHYINIKDFHASLKSTPAELEQARKDFENAGIKILGVGNVSLQKPDEGEIRHAFEYAKALTAPVMVMAPTQQTLPMIEKCVKEYNIKAAIHNHGPEDKYFPAPADVLKAVKNMDERMGLCVDIGHTSRTGTNPLDAIKAAGRRLHDIHLKDLANGMNRDSQVAVGEGVLPIPAIVQYLLKSGYKGGAMLEYEIHADNPLPGMIQSFAYMRGVLAGLRA